MVVFSAWQCEKATVKPPSRAKSLLYASTGCLWKVELTTSKV
jgi:hypothetical protein